MPEPFVTVEPISLASGAAVALMILVLPGFAPAWLFRRWELPHAMVAGPALLLVATASLVATGGFSATAMALISVVLGGIGVVPAFRWAMRSIAADRSRWIVLSVIAVAAIPWIVSALALGYPQSNTFEWYYWTLGRQLSAVGGVPGSVPEYGMEVRWLPDYISFNAVSEAYRGLGLGVPDVALISIWRVPIVVAGLATGFLVLRLWLSRTAGFVGLALVASTVFFIGKFNVYKPESLAIVVGLASLWLLVQAVRSGHVTEALMAGVGIGVAMSAHAIAATVMALLLVGIGAAEWLAVPGRRIANARLLLAGGLAAIVVSAAVGIALQGRALVAGDALRPGIVDGIDPTWAYLQYAAGKFGPLAPVPDLLDQLADGVLIPWPRMSLLSPVGGLAILIVATGLAIGLRSSSRRWRYGLLGIAVSGLGVAAAMAFFGLAFETYVPRHTGLGRIGQYVPLLLALSAAFAVEGYRSAWRRWQRNTPVRVPKVVRSAPSLVVGLLAAATIVLVVRGQYADDARITRDGRAALERLADVAEPDDIVLANPVTYGHIAFFGGAEVPLEGRQPLVEDVQFLVAVNQLLVDLHDYLEGPPGIPQPSAIADLGARWVLVSDDPRPLGARADLGGTVGRFEADDQLKLVGRFGKVGIFEVLGPTGSAPGLGPRLDLAGSTIAGALLATIGLSLLGLLAGAPLRRPRPSPWRAGP